MDKKETKGEKYKRWQKEKEDEEEEEKRDIREAQYEFLCCPGFMNYEEYEQIIFRNYSRILYTGKRLRKMVDAHIKEVYAMNQKEERVETVMEYDLRWRMHYVTKTCHRDGLKKKRQFVDDEMVQHYKEKESGFEFEEVEEEEEVEVEEVEEEEEVEEDEQIPHVIQRWTMEEYDKYLIEKCRKEGEERGAGEEEIKIETEKFMKIYGMAGKTDDEKDDIISEMNDKNIIF